MIKIAMEAGAFALKHWKLILSGVTILALSIALHVTRGTLETRTLERDKARAEAKWQKEYSAHLETAIVDKMAQLKVQNKLDIANAERNAGKAIQEAKDENAKRLRDDLAAVRLRMRVGTPEAVRGDSGEAGLADYPRLSVEPLQGNLAVVDEADANACTVNARNLDTMIQSWHALQQKLAKPPEQ